MGEMTRHHPCSCLCCVPVRGLRTQASYVRFAGTYALLLLVAPNWHDKDIPPLSTPLASRRQRIRLISPYAYNCMSCATAERLELRLGMDRYVASDLHTVSRGVYMVNMMRTRNIQGKGCSL